MDDLGNALHRMDVLGYALHQLDDLCNVFHQINDIGDVLHRMGDLGNTLRQLDDVGNALHQMDGLGNALHYWNNLLTHSTMSPNIFRLLTWHQRNDLVPYRKWIYLESRCNNWNTKIIYFSNAVALDKRIRSLLSSLICAQDLRNSALSCTPLRPLLPLCLRNLSKRLSALSVEQA